MSQDTIADALNMIRNAKKARKNTIKVKRISNLLIDILKIMKDKKAIKKYKINAKDQSIEVTLDEVVDCRAIKPRFTVKVDQIEKYRRRYLPARNIGTVLVSTSKGIMTHDQAQEAKIGGCLIAYFY